MIPRAWPHRAALLLILLAATALRFQYLLQIEHNGRLETFLSGHLRLTGD